MVTTPEVFDPSVYETLPYESVFRPHIGTSAEGVELYRVTDADLDTIAANTAGKMPAFIPRQTIGHINTDPGAREEDQPILIGFWVEPIVEYDDAVGCRCLKMKPVVRREFLDRVERIIPTEAPSTRLRASALPGLPVYCAIPHSTWA